MADIVLEHVSKVFPGGNNGVHDFNLEIADGEFVILVGPSGCGKSTTLNMIAGLLDITSGELKIGDKVMNDVAPKDRDIAMVFQSYALYPHMTVRENIAFPLTLAKLSKSEINAKVEEAAKILDLESLLDRKPAMLSGGQRQRVAMGRAIVRSPKAFLMDEPLSNLDAKLRVQMRTEIARLQQRLGTTTVYVTHDQTEAMTLGDRVVVMRLGRIQQVGTPAQLYTEPLNVFVAGFIGSPSMNFVPGHLTDDGVDTPFGVFPLTAERMAAIRSHEHAVSGDMVIVGIRPEHLEDATLLDDATLAKGKVFETTVEVMESMGSDKYVYFSNEGEQVSSKDLEELSADSEAAIGGSQLVARLSGDSPAREGDRVKLWIDPSRLHVFDHETGMNIGILETAKTAAAQ